MADKTRPPAFDLAEDLIENGPRFSFLQVLRLLRHMGHLPENIEDPKSHRLCARTVFIRPENHLAFPASDVACVKKTGDDADYFTVSASFLGLYGPASPLPTFYTEDLIEQEMADETAARDFLDIVNHRLYTLFFRCSRKYRLFFRVCEEQDRQAMETLFCLLGLGEPLHREKFPLAYPLLRYIGLLSQHPRSASGLETILSDTLNGPPVSVSQCRRRTVKIPDRQRLYLGVAGCTLGEDGVLGGQIEDYTGKFLISVGPVRFSVFQDLLPGHRLCGLIASITRFYLQDPLEYDVELILKKGEAQPLHLGGSTCSRLGLDTWIFSCDFLDEVRVLFPLSALEQEMEASFSLSRDTVTI